MENLMLRINPLWVSFSTCTPHSTSKGKNISIGENHLVPFNFTNGYICADINVSLSIAALAILWQGCIKRGENFRSYKNIVNSSIDCALMKLEIWENWFKPASTTVMRTWGNRSGYHLWTSSRQKSCRHAANSIDVGPPPTITKLSNRSLSSGSILGLLALYIA